MSSTYPRVIHDDVGQQPDSMILPLRRQERDPVLQVHRIAGLSADDVLGIVAERQKMREEERREMMRDTILSLPKPAEAEMLPSAPVIEKQHVPFWRRLFVRIMQKPRQPKLFDE